jgi:hypothetical protein
MAKKYQVADGFIVYGKGGGEIVDAKEIGRRRSQVSSGRVDSFSQ